MASREQQPMTPERARKDAMEMEADDWFVTYRGSRPVSWIALKMPENHGGSVGWAVLAQPLEDPEGKPWPEDLSREPQWVRLDDVFLMLADRLAGGVS